MNFTAENALVIVGIALFGFGMAALWSLAGVLQW